MSGVIKFLDLRPFLRNFQLTYLCCDVYRGFRISVLVVQAAAMLRLGAAAAGHSIQYVTRRTGVSRSYIYSSVTT